MVLIYEAVFKGSQRDGIKVWVEDHTLTCLKVVWGAAFAPVCSMYSSQLNSASSSTESASAWTKSPVNHQGMKRAALSSKHGSFFHWTGVEYTVSMLCKWSRCCQNTTGNIWSTFVCTACCKSSYATPLMFLLEARIVHFAWGRLIHLQ